MPIEWALPAAGELYKNRHEIYSVWDRFVARVFGPKSSVAFLGPGGAGKSVLLDFMIGKAFQENYSKPAQSRKIEHGQTKAQNNRIALTVAPGQGGPKVDAFSRVFSEKRE